MEILSVRDVHTHTRTHTRSRVCHPSEPCTDTDTRSVWDIDPSNSLHLILIDELHQL